MTLRRTSLQRFTPLRSSKPLVSHSELTRSPTARKIRTHADWLAGRIARNWGFGEERHPADWATEGKAAGPRRNARMVALGADVCLAFPIGDSPGTRGCLALAERAGIPVVVIEGVPQ